MTVNDELMLDRLARYRFPIQLLVEARKNRTSAAIADRIWSADALGARAALEWEYKSLADFGEETFCNGSPSFATYRTHEWVFQAEKQFAQEVVRNLWYEEAEGLTVYIREAGGFRAAARGDDPYDFACRLRSEGLLGELAFGTAPEWTQKLYLRRQNYDAYRTIWFSEDSLSAPQYAAKRQAKADLVTRETARLVAIDEGDTQTVVAPAPIPEGSLNTRERNVLLTIIACLCAEQKIDYSKPSKAAGLIFSLANRHGLKVSESAIEGHLKKIPNALETRAK